MAALTRTGVSSPARGDMSASDSLSGLAGENILAGQGLQANGILRGHTQFVKATTRVDCVACADAAVGESVTGLLPGQRIRIGTEKAGAGQILGGTIYSLSATIPGEWNTDVNPGAGLRLLGMSGGRTLVVS